MSVTNPNEPTYPYGGGTDNPGDNTALPGGPSNVAAVETGTPPTALIHGAIPPTLPQAQTDTILPAGMQAVPPTGAGWDVDNRGDDTGSPTIESDGSVHEPGQDETLGESETTSGDAPAAFPEPNP
jgi:hypothetical protein